MQTFVGTNSNSTAELSLGSHCGGWGLNVGCEISSEWSFRVHFH